MIFKEYTYALFYMWLVVFVWYSGLTPNTTYRVTVRSKNIKAPHFDEKGSKQMEKLSAHTEFKTLPKGNLHIRKYRKASKQK